MAFRTQKISQMTPKGSDLEATDLIEVSTIESGSYVTRSITGQELIDAIPAPSVDWGDIGGTLSAQTDLQNALDAKVPTSRTLTINGVTQDLSANRTFTISTGITIGSTAIASGTVGRILFEGTGNVVQESSSLFWDATNNRLGIGTSSPATLLNVSGNYAGTTDALVPQLLFENTNNTSSAYLAAIIRTRISTGYVGNFPELWIQSTRDASNVGITMIRTVSNHPLSFHTNDLERARIFANGNIGINTTTDAGFRLDVNGTARVQGNAQFGTGFYWDNTNNRLGIGTNSPSYLLHVIRNTPLGAELCIENLNTGINASSNFRFITNAGFTSIGMNGSNDTGVGSNRIYMYSGTGSSGISLRASQSTNDITMYTGGDTASNLRMRIFSTGNVGINTTTDAGFRLDVNGTARVSGQLTATADAVINGVNIGIGAGSQVTNTRVGRLALNFNTTGIRNTSVGQEALYATTTGSNNSAFGRGAIAVNTTGGNNSALGQNALFNNTTGNNNTVIGNNSLFAHTTGDSNSVLGADTVSGNFSGSVILGRAATATADNQFVVGSSGTNAGSVTTETNTSTQVWNVVINGVARKILLA